MRRGWLAGLVLAMGFAWPGQSERLVGELTRASTPRDKRDALRLLGTLEGVPVEAVLPLTRDPDPSVRAEAYRLLGAPADDPAPEVRVLNPSLDDPDPRVRRAAVRAGTQDTRALIARLEDDALEVRIEAAQALGDRPEAALALVAHADAPLPELRAAVIDALARSVLEPRRGANVETLGADASAQGGAAGIEARRAVADLERVLARALEDRDTEVVLAALRGYARHPALALPEAMRTLASGVQPQLARAAQNLLAAQRTWDDPPWLTALEHTLDGNSALEALEASLPEGESRATAPLLEWLTRAPEPLRPRIRALIERTRRPLSERTRTTAH